MNTHALTCTYANTALKAFVEPAGSQTAFTCCLWQPKRRRLALNTDNLLFVLLVLLFRHLILTVCRFCRWSLYLMAGLYISLPLSVSVMLCVCVSLLFLSASLIPLTLVVSILLQCPCGREGSVWKTVEHFITGHRRNPLQIRFVRGVSQMHYRGIGHHDASKFYSVRFAFMPRFRGQMF